MLDFSDCEFVGPALPESFVRLDLADLLERLGLLTETQGRHFEAEWGVLRRQLLTVGALGGAERVHRQIVRPHQSHRDRWRR